MSDHEVELLLAERDHLRTLVREMHDALSEWCNCPRCGAVNTVTLTDLLDRAFAALEPL